jgi:glycerol-3-phosphate dehydrogenase (NAD(P)+)
LNNQLSIVGGGSWGTALAIVLAPRFDRVRLWVYEADLAREMQTRRENSVYLPGFRLPENVEPTASLEEAVQGAAIVLSATPSHHTRAIYRQMLPWVTKGAAFVSATKGLEEGSLLRVSEVIRQVTEERAQVAVISGPTFAREVAAGHPTALVVGAEDATFAARVQTAFAGRTFRLYRNTDVAGVELGAALKNVIAIGAGICAGLGLGTNSFAALVTRGLAEISRLAEALGGQRATLAGLAGLGDLVLTCSGELSRNRQVGIALSQGRRIEDIVAGMRMVAEGVKTTYSAVELARRHGIEMPITEQMYTILNQGRSPQSAIQELMERSLKDE